MEDAVMPGSTRRITANMKENRPSKALFGAILNDDLAEVQTLLKGEPELSKDALETVLRELGKEERVCTLTIGPADFVFMAFFLSCAHRFRLDVRRTLISIFVALTLALYFVLLAPWPVPALLPMAAAFLIVNFRQFKLSRQELQAVCAAAVIVLGAGIAFLVAGKR